MDFSWNSYIKPIIALAPMAGITTYPFRSICREYGADIVYSPMLSSNAIIHNPTKTLNIASFLPAEDPVIVQIFGYDGDLIARAANIAQNGLKCAGIDINMGCPVPMITGNECGSALLRDLDKSAKMIGTVRDNFNGQLSVKIRLGWNSFNTIGFVKKLEQIGIDAISVHGRTAKQGYRGEADWEAINRIAESVEIPVIGNGDIDSHILARERLSNTRLVGVMIGRAALGNPWLFEAIKEGREVVPNNKEISDTIKIQTERSIEFVGEKTGIMEMRKHLCWYLTGFSGVKELRKKAVRVETKEDIQKLITTIEQMSILG